MEEWKIIAETFGKYSVSNTGQIKRNKREGLDKWDRIRSVKERIIKPSRIGSGYLGVTLRIGNNDVKRSVHRLVATEFLLKTDASQEVNHKDLNKQNNVCENLEWIDKRSNVHHCMNSKTIGVSYVKHKNQWSSRIMINGKREFLGCFDNIKDAKNAYDKRLSQI